MQQTVDKINQMSCLKGKKMFEADSLVIGTCHQAIYSVGDRIVFPQLTRLQVSRM